MAFHLKQTIYLGEIDLMAGVFTASAEVAVFCSCMTTALCKLYLVSCFSFTLNTAAFKAGDSLKGLL